MSKLIVVLLLGAAACAAMPAFVTIHPSSDPSLALRQCSSQVYATAGGQGQDTDYIFEIVEGEHGAVTLRWFVDPSLALCSNDSSSIFLFRPSDPAVNCTWEQRQGLSDASLLSFSQSGRYLAVTQSGTSGACQGAFKASDSDVALLPVSAIENAATATWAVVDATSVRMHPATNTDLSLRDCSDYAYAARPPTFYTIRLASNKDLSIRHCNWRVYATKGQDDDHIFQVVGALNGAADSISLRSYNYPEQYMCLSSASSTNLILGNPDASACSFKKVAGLSDKSKISLMHGSKYVALTGKLSESCGGGYSSPESDVYLESNPTASRATWFLEETTVSSTKSSSYEFVLGAPLDPKMGSAAFSLRTAYNPSMFFCASSTGRALFLTGEGHESECTFSREAGLSDKGLVSFFHDKSGKYLYLGSTITGPCSSEFSAPEADIVLINPVPERKLATWTLTLNGVAPKTASLKADFSRVQHDISPLLYGVFFEEINFAGEGGIYAELIRNRDFEAQGRGDLGDVKGTRVANADDIRPWTHATASGKATVALQSAHQPFETNPMALHIKTTGATSITLKNPGFWGINCRAGMSYKGSFYASTTEGSFVITLSLVSQNGAVRTKTDVVKVGDEAWSKYTFSFECIKEDTTSVFSMKIDTSSSLGGLYLDSISLFPGDAVAGLFRKDVFDKLAALRPAFVRFPGGNYLEGNEPETRWQWKNTIGEVAARPGHYNDAWGYWTNDGLGLLEYLVLCEELNSLPQLSIFTGYFLSHKYIPLAESGEIIQDAVDAIEFANGAISSTWGAKRAEGGHPKSFNLNRIEVGNEETMMKEYRQHYNAITKAVWDQYPEINVVASGRWGADIEGNPCTSGSRCDAWDDHYYRTPDQMADMSTQYDSYSRSMPKVFVGEYAANVGGEQTLQAGLAEASFMIGFERNADVVVQASFAPLFRHTRGTQWAYDLISYNSSALYVLPAYHVQRIFREKQGDHTYPSSFSGITTAVATSLPGGSHMLKLLNYGKAPALVSVSLEGLKNVPAEGTLTLLTAPSSAAANTLDNPEAVTPYSEKVRTGKKFTLVLPAWSLGILEL